MNSSAIVKTGTGVGFPEHQELSNLKMPRLIETSKQAPNYHLGAPVMVSRYGVLGLTIIDRAPQPRWVRYDDPEWQGVVGTTGTLGMGEPIESDPVRQWHFNDTEKGFAVLRIYILPAGVMQFMSKDKFLAPALLNKCFLENTLPGSFDEVHAGFAHSVRDSKPLVDAVVEAAGERNSAVSYTPHESWPYLSFHPWWMYTPVVEAMKTATTASLKNIDDLLSLFDKQRSLQLRDRESPGA